MNKHDLLDELDYLKAELADTEDFEIREALLFNIEDLEELLGE